MPNPEMACDTALMSTPPAALVMPSSNLALSRSVVSRPIIQVPALLMAL